MKETGIIMSGDHPKLIIDGIKTMTRRTWGLEDINKAPDTCEYVWDSICQQHRFYDKYYKDAPPVIIKCPYGQVGDRLWVRETWRIESFMDGEPILFSFKDGKTFEEDSNYNDTINYEEWYERVCIQSTEDAEKAYKQDLVRQDDDGIYHWDIGKSPCRWRPSIFMPRWASRILLEITEVRVERLGDIETLSAWDCMLEGLEPGIDIKHRFVALWDSLNARRGYSWESNPWVWVLEFKRINIG